MLAPTVWHQPNARFVPGVNCNQRELAGDPPSQRMPNRRSARSPCRWSDLLCLGAAPREPSEVSTAIGRDMARAPGPLVGAGRRGTETPEQTILAKMHVGSGRAHVKFGRASLGICYGGYRRVIPTFWTGALFHAGLPPLRSSQFRRAPRFARPWSAISNAEEYHLRGPD